jgi:hypothetical protein
MPSPPLGPYPQLRLCGWLRGFSNRGGRRDPAFSVSATPLEPVASDHHDQRDDGNRDEDPGDPAKLDAGQYRKNHDERVQVDIADDEMWRTPYSCRTTLSSELLILSGFSPS